MIQLLNTVFDANMQEFALEQSRRGYYKKGYLSELKRINLFSVGCAEWDKQDEEELRQKYKKKMGYDYR